MFNEDLFQGTSFSDLLPTSPDVSMSYYNLSDDEPLGLPSMLPNLMTPQISPTSDSVNILDMIRQDVMLGNGLQSSVNSASTEVTYASQYSRYSTPSAVPFTSAGDVFLPTIPITTASNTFIKPMDTFVKPAYQSRTATSIMKPNSRSCSPNSPNQIPVNPFVLDDEPVVSSQRTTTTCDRKHAKYRHLSSSTSSKKKKSSSRSHGSHSHSKSSSRKSKQSSRSRSKGQSLLLMNSPPQSAISTHAGSSRSTAATHAVTRAANISSKSTSALNTGTVSSTLATVAQNVNHRAAAETLKTVTTTSYTASRARYSPNTYASVFRSNYSTTCTVTSHTISGPRTPVSIISPMQASYNRPANSTPTNTSRVPPCATKTAVKSASSDLLGLSSTQPSCGIPATNAGHVSHSGTGDTLLRSRLTMLSPYACASSPETTCVATATKTSNATVKHRISYTGRIIRTPYSVTHANTYTTTTTTTTTTAASRTLFTQNTFAFAPGTTLYAARKVPSTRGSRSVAETNESQIFAISGGKASYLTLSSDFTTTCTSFGAAQSTTTVTAGVGSHVLSTISDSTPRPRNQIFFSIANSHMSTTSSLGYLVTSPIGSEIITSRNAATSSQDATTGAAAMLGSHTITAITPEALSKLRNTLLSATNVPSTAGGLSSLVASTMSTEANRTRGPVTILSNQLISTVHQCDSTKTLKSPGASSITQSTRTVFSGTPTQGLYTITTGGTPHAPSTTAAEPAARQVNRMIMSILPNVHATSNSQHSARAVASNITTRTFSATPSQTTYIIAPSVPAGDRTRTSRLAYGIPIFQSSIPTTAALTSTTVGSPSFPGSTDGNGSYTLPSGTGETHSKLRNRLTGHVTTTESLKPGTTPITAYTYSRTRAQQNVYAFPARPVMYAPSTEPSEITSGNSSMALITLTTTSVATPTTSSPHRQTLPVAHSDSPSPTPTLCSITTATPTITNTGSHYTIKLAATNELATASKSTVTAAVTTPITAASLSPPEHSFMEHHHPVSRLRTFPGPRTYSVAQRSAAGSGQQRPSAGSVAPRTAKKIIANPAPLQIFADVVCPPANAQSTAAATSAHPKPPFKLSHSSGSSTLVVPQYKNTVFKNLSTVAHANPERLSSRFLSPRSSSERLVLNRSVALVGPPPTFRRPAMVGPVPASPIVSSHRTFACSQRTARLLGRVTPSVVEATTIDLPSSPDEDQDE